MPTIKLKPRNGEPIAVDVEVACCSQTIKTMLDDLSYKEGDDEVIPLENVHRVILEMIIKWATHHKDDPPPEEDGKEKKKRTVNISDWDANFLNIDQGMLLELIVAADYLNITGLLYVASQTVANMMKGKTTGEIRSHFDIENDFTPEEAEEERQGYEWCLKYQD